MHLDNTAKGAVISVPVRMETTKTANARKSPPQAAPNAPRECGAGRMMDQYSMTPPKNHASPYRFPYTPTGHSTCSFIPSQRSGRNSQASGPHKSWFLPQSNDVSAIPGWQWRYETTYRLYPNVERLIIVPLVMGSSVYTLPEAPTIGFVRGRTSSRIGARTSSTTMG